MTTTRTESIFLLCRHPPHPFRQGEHLKANEVMGVYYFKEEPKSIAAQKNRRSSQYYWTVQRKKIVTTF